MPKPKTTNQHLDQKLVTDFATTRALERELFDWMNAARDEMLGQLRAGFACPTGGPYVVVIEKSKQKVIDWKEIARQAIEDQFVVGKGKAPGEAFALSVKTVEGIENSAKKKTILRLVIKTNPHFEHDLGSKLLGQLQKVKFRKGAKK